MFSRRGRCCFEEGKIFRCLWTKIRMEKENKKDCSLSLSLFIEEGNSVCLSALSQGSLCPLLRANTRIFAREERERERERERKEEEKERERETRE